MCLGVLVGKGKGGRRERLEREKGEKESLQCACTPAANRSVNSFIVAEEGGSRCGSQIRNSQTAAGNE